MLLLPTERYAILIVDSHVVLKRWVVVSIRRVIRPYLGLAVAFHQLASGLENVPRMSFSRRELLLGSFPAAAAIVALARRVDGQEAGVLALSPKDVCTLTCASTLGPCYYSSTVTRRDITEGVVGCRRC
jgi:hypothetical protein